jgi:hypothetical protein
MTRHRFGLGFVLALILALGSSCTNNSEEESRNGTRPLELLVMRLQNQGYGRSLDNNAYELSFRASPPRTVVVVIKTTSKADPNVVRTVSQTVVDFVKRKGKSEFNLDDIEVEIDRSSLDR